VKTIFNIAQKSRFWTDNALVFREIKHLSKIATLAVVFAILAALFEGFNVGLIASFLQGLVEPNARPIQTGIQWFDVSILGINLSRSDRMYRISGLILLATWTRVCLSYFASLCTLTTQFRLVERVRRQIFEQLQSLSLSYFSKTRSGDLINTVISETDRLHGVFGGVSALLTTGTTALVYVIWLFRLSWQLTIIALFLFYLLVIGLSVINRYIREFSFEIPKAAGNFTSILTEFVSGIRTVHAFVSQDFERRRFNQALSALVKANIQTNLIVALVKPLADGLSVTILIGLVLAALTGSISKDVLPVTSLLTFFYVLFRFVPLFQVISSIKSSFSSLAGTQENIKQLLRRDDKPYFLDGTRNFSGLARSIDLVSVDFGYHRDHLVLHNITLAIKQGEMTALVGASGAGKTTLVDLIPRLIEPVQGTIRVDGIDLREFRIASLRRKMAIVSQDTFIFNTSVYNNIAYGSEEASREQVIEAARLANALEFIQYLPDGFETVLGDRGVRLSGGQRQRLAIARALLRNPEILILDEATSALDSISERLIQDALEKLSVGRTVIAIAHRLSTIARADKVVVLEQGHIVEQGRYQDLLEQRGKLWNYHQIQYNLNAPK
jgi:subfamily B ATP-binding cassette protein MsbA